MARPIGQVLASKQEEISLGPAPAEEVVNQPAAVVSQALAVPTFRSLEAVRTRLNKLLGRLTAEFNPRSVEYKLLKKEKGGFWKVEHKKGARRETLATRGVKFERLMNARIDTIEQVFNGRVAPLHAELTSFLENPGAVLGDDGKAYVLNQDAYVEMLQNPNISTDADKVVKFLRKQQRVMLNLKPKTDLEKETLGKVKLAIDRFINPSASTLGK